MQIDILTIFPEFFENVFNFGIVRRAKEAGLVAIEFHDLRSWARDKHRTVDDRPFGGGDGMVLKPGPVFRAVEEIIGTADRDAFPTGTRVVLLTPRGRPLKQAVAAEFADAAKRLVIICGRYEGVDERVSEGLATDEISIGDYVISGGEPAAVVLVDALTRLLPDALGSDTSAQNDSFSRDLLDHPSYTQPREFRGMKVPEVLLGGDHGKIEEWRRKMALKKTREVRRDLLEEVEDQRGAGSTENDL